MENKTKLVIINHNYPSTSCVTPHSSSSLAQSVEQDAGTLLDFRCVWTSVCEFLSHLPSVRESESLNQQSRTDNMIESPILHHFSQMKHIQTKTP